VTYVEGGVEVKVVDSGVGIPSKLLRVKIFSTKLVEQD
jgi:hypothetical protein